MSDMTSPVDQTVRNLVLSEILIGAGFLFACMAIAKFATKPYFSEAFVSLAPVMRTKLTGSSPQLIAELARLRIEMEASVTLAMTPCNLRLCGAAVFGAFMHRAEFRDVPVNPGDKVLAAAHVGAGVGGTVPSCADLLKWTSLQETFVVIAKFAARNSNHATALTLAIAWSMLWTKWKFVAI